MAILPVIVGMGGINCAGRSSGFHSFKRIIADVLPPEMMENTWKDLAHRMGIVCKEISAEKYSPTAKDIELIKQGTLIRKIESFDLGNMVCHHKAKLDSKTPSAFIIPKHKLPNPLPPCWQIQALDNDEVKVTIEEDELSVLIPGKMSSRVSCAGNIPTGFDPGKLYHSHHHPRGLKLAIYGINDALNSLGIDWEEILSHIKPDEIAVFAGSALGQIDEYSMGGLIGQPLIGNRVNSKMIALSLAEMPADFINSYVLRSVGTTGTNMGACASFLYNLRQGIQEIQSGKAKVVIVGNSDAPVVPEIIEGFRAMGALATDDDLCALDNTEILDHRRACRPFSTNVGFTVAEASQFIILMNDELALKLGANIYGSIADVFINADGNKKSISKPGIGNYITVAKATALASAILGQENLENTYIQSHGTSTPQNRTTESHILNEIAKAFSIKSWPVAAIKAYLGHSIGAAGGDQLIASLGAWQYDWIPGIKTIDHIAEDVHRSHLNILLDHYYVGKRCSQMKAVIINAKGFGGNNATGVVLSPTQTLHMLQHKHHSRVLKSYWYKNESIKAKRDWVDSNACLGDEKIIYNFGTSIMDETSVSVSSVGINLSEFVNAIDLPNHNPYHQYCPEKKHESANEYTHNIHKNVGKTDKCVDVY